MSVEIEDPFNEEDDDFVIGEPYSEAHDRTDRILSRFVGYSFVGVIAFGALYAIFGR